MAHSTPSVWVRLVTAAFAAAECADPGPPVQANVAPMFRMAPEPPAASRRRCSSCEQKKVPSRTICVTARHPFGVMSSAGRSEEHTSELQSLMRISYAVFCLKKKTKQVIIKQTTDRYKHYAVHNTNTAI